jgi:UDP-GlcNAc:undecaprenyl-phosphate GlcNAc-1-phosphate transferase
VIVLVLLAGALVPYLAVNLGLVGRKIFLGDAGSMVMGYFLAWTLIHLSQSVPENALSTVDVLWCVALPVLDTLAVMVRRIREGKSPFKPDRGHIHHMMLRAGLGPRTTLVELVMLAIVLALAGMLTHSLAPGSNLLAFGALTLIYIATTNRLWQRQQAQQAGTGTLPAGGNVHPLDGGMLGSARILVFPHKPVPPGLGRRPDATKRGAAASE